MKNNVISKEYIVENTLKSDGFYINTDNITYDLQGKGMAQYLTSIGFNVIKNFDTGANGIVLTEEGIEVSTNGYCSIIKNK